MGEQQVYRTNGAIGALLDEYERALSDLKASISDINHENFIKIIDSQTDDEDCRSVQTILTHVIYSGHCYIISVRKNLEENINYPKKNEKSSIKEYLLDLDILMQANVDLFSDYPDVQLETFKNEEKILTNWGQRYDIDQMFEHAIVHILRHRRQIDRFKLKM